MATPPLPPRPLDQYNHPGHRQPSLPPPLPPLPPDFHPSYQNQYNAGPYPQTNAPHLTEPLLAPKPQKLMEDLSANMASRLDDQISFSPPPQPYGPSSSSYPSMPQMPYNSNAGPGGFRPPPDPYRRQSPYPQQQQGYQSPSPGQIIPAGYGGTTPPRTGPSPQNQYQQQPQPQPGWANPRTNQDTLYASPPANQTQFPSPQYNQSPPNGHQRSATVGLTQSMQNLTFGGPPEAHRPQNMPPHARTASYTHSQTLPPQNTDTRRTSPTQDPPALTTTFPNVNTLLNSQPQLGSDPARQVRWARDVFWLVDRSQQTGGTSPPAGTAKIQDPQLVSIAEHAITLILRLIPPSLPLAQPTPQYLAEAVYMRGRLASTGSFPDLVPQSSREAFRYFEAAARAGYAPGWFQLGRDYEGVNDFTRARNCFEKGVKAGVESCCYRMGMAHLLGQLSTPVDVATAIPLLQAGANNASMEFPQPAYVWGLLLLGDFPAATIPPPLLQSFLPPGASPLQEVKRSIERAAYLGFSPAQYKLGHAYEYAIAPFPFDPLLSVQYYSLASQQGEEEADMALSKWFLCGSEGAFEKDENLAYTFAEKAARRGLPTAMFALGYYAEVGVGKKIDLEAAQKWYNKAAEQGNTDASDRLKALSQPSPQTLSRQQHEDITDVKLIRRRTQAKNEALAQGRSQGRYGGGAAEAAAGSGNYAEEVVGNIRKQSLLHKPPPHRDTASSGGRVNTPPESRPGRGRGRGGGGGRTGSKPPSPTDHRRPSIPGAASTPSPGPQRQQPQQQQQRPLALTQSPAQAYAALHDNGPTPLRQSTKTSGPATFQEMGFQSTKLEDKECVIM